MSAEIILHNAKIATNEVPSLVEAIAISDGKVTATGGNEEILRLRGPATRVIDGRGRTVIPGLNDSHMHPIRGGLNYNLELRWDGIPRFHHRGQSQRKSVPINLEEGCNIRRVAQAVFCRDARRLRYRSSPTTTSAGQ